MVKQLSFAQSLNIQNISVESSAIKALGYGEFTGQLIIQFHPSKDGVEYLYFYSNVPQTLAAQFLKSDSKGKFYNEQIKSQGFECTRITLV